MSYGRVCIGGDATEKWNKLPRLIANYKISPRNLEVDKSRINLLIRDAIDAVDREFDFSRYSFTVIFMGAQIKEYGMMGLCGYPGMLGWGTQDILKTKSGQVVNGGIAIYCYQAHLGTLFHDVAHILGGVKGGNRMVPCLYDHDLQARPGPLREVFLGSTINMGSWDPMSCHYYKWELPPPGLSSWTKLRLNWMDPSKVKGVKASAKAEVLLSPLAEGAGETLAIKVPLSETTYYLVENRQPIGFDKNLPGSGVLIMYADDMIPECRHEKAPVKLMNANPGTPHLDGAAFDVGKKDIFVDEKNGLKIQLAAKIGNSYKIVINPDRK
jgi:M6 family metalloprotease-like protein